MEGEDKSKKVAKEKRSVKKTKGAAVPIEKMPVVTETKKVPAVSEAKQTPVVTEAKQMPARKSLSTGTAKRSARSKQSKEPTYEQIQLRAYFIGERRKSLGISGDETSDWVQAERELKEELAAK
jgi:hypothetical protein